MNRRKFTGHLLATSSFAALAPTSVFGNDDSVDNISPNHYGKGDLISRDVYVHDKHRKKIQLLNLLRDGTDGKVNILYLFGGGALGVSNKTGGLWCTDSFEDMHILRILYKKYRDQNVTFLAVACPPVFDTHKLGHPRSVFLNQSDESQEYQEAIAAFVNSTQKSFRDGVLPTEPYYDFRFRLLMNKKRRHDSGYGEVAHWQGNFRKADETQNYGVPNLWLVSGSGLILTAPFRGNVYHGLPETYSIQYTLTDVDSAIQSILAS